MGLVARVNFERIVTKGNTRIQFKGHQEKVEELEKEDKDRI